METINDRMQQIVDTYFGGNKSAFAEKIGIAKTSITNYLGKQRASKPSSDMLAKIVNNVAVDAHWLLTGEGTMDGKSQYTKPDIDRLQSEIKRLEAEVKRLSDIKMPTYTDRMVDVSMRFAAAARDLIKCCEDRK